MNFNASIPNPTISQDGHKSFFDFALHVAKELKQPDVASGATWRGEIPDPVYGYWSVILSSEPFGIIRVHRSYETIQVSQKILEQSEQCIVFLLVWSYSLRRDQVPNTYEDFGSARSAADIKTMEILKDNNYHLSNDSYSQIIEAFKNDSTYETRVKHLSALISAQ